VKINKNQTRLHKSHENRCGRRMYVVSGGREGVAIPTISM